MSDGKVYVVFWRKRWHSGSARKYVSVNRGYTENWRLALRFADRSLAELYARRIDADEVVVAEETRPLPAPKISPWLMGAER